MCRPQGYVPHTFCLERVLFSAQQSGKGTFFTVSVCEECSFQAQQSGKGCVLILVWYWNSGKGCNFTFFFSGKGEKFLSGMGKGMPPWAAHPYPQSSQEAFRGHRSSSWQPSGKMLRGISKPFTVTRPTTVSGAPHVINGDLTPEHFVLGYIRAMQHENSNVKALMLSHIQDFMQDAMDYSWENARPFEKQLLQYLERDLLSWKANAKDQRIPAHLRAARPFVRWSRTQATTSVKSTTGTGASRRNNTEKMPLCTARLNRKACANSQLIIATPQESSGISVFIVWNSHATPTRTLKWISVGNRPTDHSGNLQKTRNN